MFIKITRSGPRQYVQLVEAYRDDAGKAKHRTLATLGRLDQIADNLDSVIAGLLKASGRSPDLLSTAEPAIAFESARALGDVWALQELWQTLGFGELRRIFKQTRHTTDVEALLRVLVVNRLGDPESKLGVCAGSKPSLCRGSIPRRSPTSNCCAAWTRWSTTRPRWMPW